MNRIPPLAVSVLVAAGAVLAAGFTASNAQPVDGDLHGHGRTPGEREKGLSGMGHEMAAVVRALGHERVRGCSPGGGVALPSTAQHPGGRR
jgi:hypothetical protein